MLTKKIQEIESMEIHRKDVALSKIICTMCQRCQTQTQSTHGVSMVTIPLHDGSEVTLKGICLDSDEYIKIRNHRDAPLLAFKPTYPEQPINTEVHISTSMSV